jgi:hypothetical protein
VLNSCIASLFCLFQFHRQYHRGIVLPPPFSHGQRKQRVEEIQINPRPTGFRQCLLGLIHRLRYGRNPSLRQSRFAGSTRAGAAQLSDLGGTPVGSPVSLADLRRAPSKVDKHDRYRVDVSLWLRSGAEIFLNNALLANGQAVRKAIIVMP